MKARVLVAIDSVWQRFDSTHPHFEYKRIDWAPARVGYRPSAAMMTATGHGLATDTPSAFVNWQRSVWDVCVHRASALSESVTSG